MAETVSDLTEIVYLSEAKYQEMKQSGQLDPDAIYMTDSNISTIITTLENSISGLQNDISGLRSTDQQLQDEIDDRVITVDSETGLVTISDGTTTKTFYDKDAVDNLISSSLSGYATESYVNTALNSYATKTYVDDLVGNIATRLDNINGEVI